MISRTDWYCLLSEDAIAMPFGSFLAGFVVGLTLIVAIGPQATFVLQQGISGRHVRPIFALCVICDSLLIMAGVSGAAASVALVPGLDQTLRLAGAAFIAIYGLAHFRQLSWRMVPVTGDLREGTSAPPPATTLSRSVAVFLALTFLNPHVYVDTVLVLGSISAQYPDPAAFGAGAVCASVVFCGALCFGGGLLRPLLHAPAAQGWLNATIGCVLLAIATGLALPAFR